MISFKRYLDAVSLLESLRKDQIDSFNKTSKELGLDSIDVEKYITGDSTNDNLIKSKIKDRDSNNKISKLVKHLYSDIDENTLRNFIEKYKAHIKYKDNYKFKIKDDVQYCYNFENDSKLAACMNKDYDLTKALDYLPVKGLVLFNGEEPVGRALIWDLGSDTYVDRVYPADDKVIIEMFHTYSKSKNWKYRESQFANKYYKYGSKSYDTILKNYKSNGVKNMPYMDTFKFGKIVGSDLLLTNDPNKKYPIMFNDSRGAVISADADYTNDVDYKTSVYVNSLDVSPGSKMKIDYSFGRFNVEWAKGDWYSGTFPQAVWYDGTFHKDGMWESGNFNGGVFNGNWEYGEFNDGTFNGTWNDGDFRGGTFNGEWGNGEFYDGIFKGTFESGNFHGGTFDGGVFESGYWNNGEWKSGEWKSGWIYDPENKGNLQDNWKEYYGYIESPIDPGEYWRGKVKSQRMEDILNSKELENMS